MSKLSADEIVGGAMLATAPGLGGVSEVKVYDPVAGALRRQFFAFDAAFRGGVALAADFDTV
jgi:hypothetical protein